MEKRAKPDDLVAFAPRWVDPIGREELGKDLATVDREAYADVSRFPRAIEVSIRGKHLEDLEGWAPSDATRFGGSIAADLLALPRGEGGFERAVPLDEPIAKHFFQDAQLGVGDVFRVEGPKEERVFVLHFDAE